MRERRLATVSDTEICPEEAHIHSHLDTEANVRAQQIVRQMQQTPSVIPIINTLPVLPLHGHGAGTGTSTPTTSIGPYGPYPSHSAQSSLPPTPEEPLSPKSSVASLRLKSALKHACSKEDADPVEGQGCACTVPGTRGEVNVARAEEDKCRCVGN